MSIETKLRKPRYPQLDPHGFLERAFVWLESDIDIGIFYAALDLRFTFEKILIKHGFASDDFSKSFTQLKWQPRKLHDALQKRFAGQINLAKSYRFFNGEVAEKLQFGCYLSMPVELFADYGKLDNYLHAQWGIPIGTRDKAWLKENRAFLVNFADKLVPHANPDNSLSFFTLPNTKHVEVEWEELEKSLRKHRVR